MSANRDCSLVHIVVHTMLSSGNGLPKREQAQKAQTICGVT